MRLYAELLGASSRRTEHLLDRSRRLRRDTRGAAMTEYVILVGTVGLAIVFALITVGPKLVKDFGRSRAILTSPMP
jgi:Flp pilus assembly pilin Flp